MGTGETMRTAQLVARCLALLILVAGFTAAAAALQPRQTDFDEFIRALDSDSVVTVVLDKDLSTAAGDEDTKVWTATWSTGPFHWRRGQVVDRPTARAGFHTDMRQRRVAVETDDGETSLVKRMFSLPSWFGALLTITWIGTFIVMLGSVPRWGNRWAWFWMFVVGQIGVLLYLLVEPRPLWKEQHAAAETIAREPVPTERITGGVGCVSAIVTGIAAAFLATAVGWAVNSLLG